MENGHNNKDLSDGLDLVMGELGALKAFCSALIATHPDPVALQRAFGQLSEQTTADLLPHSDVPDHSVDGLQNVATILSAQIAARIRG